MKPTNILSVVISFSLFVSFSQVFAQDEIRQERVQFKKGATSAVIKGRLKGYSAVDYLLRAGAGQTMLVSMQRSNLANDFNVLPAMIL
jgi:hypothetical protein